MKSSAMRGYHRIFWLVSGHLYTICCGIEAVRQLGIRVNGIEANVFNAPLCEVCGGW